MQEGNNTEEYIDESEVEKEEGGGWRDKFKNLIEGRYFVPIVIVLIAIIAFSLGRVSGMEEKREPVRVLDNSGEVKGASINTSPPNPSPNLGEGSSALSDTGGNVIASKNGTKYHYPWCAGAKQISRIKLVLILLKRLAPLVIAQRAIVRD